MKKFYTLTLVLSYLSISLSSSAQYSAIYTAVTTGNWHKTSGSIWEPTEPPANCSNCLILVNVNGTVDLNTNVTLSNGSALVIGGTGNTTVLSIGNSGASGFSGSYSITLANDGSNSNIQLVNSNALISAGAAGTYDGILTSYLSGGVTTYFKQIGNKPSGFSGNSVVSNAPAPYGTLQEGAETLNSAGTLPIILSSFSAVVDNSQVKLDWTTQLEINSDHFVIQSSTNGGSSWNNVGTVEAHGNSATPIDYSFTDTKPASGTSEYRLQMVDKDGSAAYSTVVSVHLGLATSVSIYPNPASNYVNVVLGSNSTGNVSVRLINTAGQLLMEKTVSDAAGTTVALTVTNFPAGNYLIVVVGSDGTQQVNKLLIAK